MSDFPTVVGAESGDDVRSSIHNPNLVSAMRAWRARIEDAALLVGKAAAQRYRSSTIGIRCSVPATLRPCCGDVVVAIVEIARANGVDLYPISIGHDWDYCDTNPVTDNRIAVNLSGLDRIVDIDAELGLVILEPGITQQKLKDFLDPERIIALGRYAPAERSGQGRTRPPPEEVIVSGIWEIEL